MAIAPGRVLEHLGTEMTDGKLLLVTATTSGGAQTLHEHRRAERFERLRIWAQNKSGAGVDLTLQWVGTAAADEMLVTIASKAAPALIVDNWLVPKGGTVKAYAASGSAVTLYCEVLQVD